MDRAIGGGSLDPYKARTEPQYGDFSNVADFQAALDQVASVNSWFASQPAQFRQTFGENPANVLAFVDDPANLEDAHRLRLISDEEYERLKPKPKPTSSSKPAAGEPAAGEPLPTTAPTATPPNPISDVSGPKAT